MRLILDSRRSRRLRALLGATLVTVVALPAAGRLIDRREAPAVRSALKPAHDPRASAGLPITALGRIQPKDGVLTIAAPVAEAGLAIVSVLHVRAGDEVERGQLLATLRGRDEQQAMLVSRERRRAIARARLTALTSGGKADDLTALRSEVGRDEAALAHADADARRSQQLHDYGLLDTAALQAQQSRLAIAARALDASRARLNGLSSVRPADVAVAEAELRAIDAEVEEARARLESTLVRAPFDGRILVVHAQPGQGVGSDGVLAMGRTSEMFVDAEVLEEDLARARVGQRARITGDVLPAGVDGVVEEIGVLIGRREVFTTDPAAFTDSRVVHVKVRAESPALLARYINARVTVVIEP